MSIPVLFFSLLGGYLMASGLYSFYRGKFIIIRPGQVAFEKAVGINKTKYKTVYTGFFARLYSSFLILISLFVFWKLFTKESHLIIVVFWLVGLFLYFISKLFKNSKDKDDEYGTGFTR